MKKIESINDLVKGQEVYIKAKYYLKDTTINDYPIRLQLTNDNDDDVTLNNDFKYREDSNYKVELFTTEQLELPVVGKEYDFSDDGENWTECEFKGFSDGDCYWKYIRPIQQPSEEVIKAIELLKLNGYTKIEK